MIRITDIRKRHSDPHAFAVDRSTPLGNPYRPVIAGDTLERYERWLQDQLFIDDGDSAVAAYLRVLLDHALEHGELHLACWCGDDSPTCHGNVIRALLLDYVH